MVAKQQGGGRNIPGLPVGQRIPLSYPAGAAVMPWRPAEERSAWLATATTDSVSLATELLDSITELQVAVFRPRADDAGLVDVLADLLDAAGSDLLDGALRGRVLRQLANLTSRPYTRADLAGTETMPVSYLAAPVFDADGVARHEIQLGPLRSAVPASERSEYISMIRAAAESVSDR